VNQLKKKPVKSEAVPKKQTSITESQKALLKKKLNYSKSTRLLLVGKDRIGKKVTTS
jgi:hypothetical protein